MVGFKGTYHAILGRSCYAKFMAVPNYTYLKLKMSGPNGVITIDSTYEHAYDCDVECIEYAEAIVESEALIANLDQLGSEVPDSKPIWPILLYDYAVRPQKCGGHVPTVYDPGLWQAHRMNRRGLRG